MGIKINMFPASYGDCFLVEFNYEKRGKSYNILIDTGFKETYRKFLHPYLIGLNKENKVINLSVVTHVDMDHISGMLEFMNENGDSTNPKIIKVNEVWHNSYRHLINRLGTNEITLNKSNQILIQSIKEAGYLEENNLEDEIEDIGAKEGSTLGQLIVKNGYNWNGKFSGNAIKAERPVEVCLTDEIKLIVLSPNQKKLNDLKKYWKYKLIELGYIGSLEDDEYFDDAFEYLLSREKDELEEKIEDISWEKIRIEKIAEQIAEKEFEEDTSVTNGSSISFILEYRNKAMLFLADSHSDIIVKNLKEYYGDKKVLFDVIKISHHGSKFNTSPELLDIVDSKIYLISTNGKKYKHPDIETIVRIISREVEFERKIFFNYKNHLVEIFDNQELEKKYKYNLVVLEENEYIIL